MNWVALLKVSNLWWRSVVAGSEALMAQIKVRDVDIVKGIHGPLAAVAKATDATWKRRKLQACVAIVVLFEYEASLAEEEVGKDCSLRSWA